MRPELTYVRCKVSWRFWAFGYHWQRTPRYSHPILTIGFGPLRFQFLKWEADTADKHRTQQRGK